jgi:hypothetical protein
MANVPLDKAPVVKLTTQVSGCQSATVESGHRDQHGPAKGRPAVVPVSDASAVAEICAAIGKTETEETGMTATGP